jgi:hypothetical protein
VAGVSREGTLLAASDSVEIMMPTSERRSTGKQNDCASSIRRLARRQESLRRRISKLEEDADSLALDLANLADDLEGQPVATVSDSRRGDRRSGHDARAALQHTAEAGVGSVRMLPRSDGSADVLVDGGKQFTLPPTLADLLAILTTSRGWEPRDGLVGWKTLDDIARLLEKKSGRTFTLHAVTQQVYRLRREIFERGGVNPWLVQTNRRLGVRFALRLSPAQGLEIARGADAAG